MPADNHPIREIRGDVAAAIWRAIQRPVESALIELLEDGRVDPGEALTFAIRYALGELADHTPRILNAAEELGNRIDDALGWGWVRNADRRKLLEIADDEIAPFLRFLAKRALQHLLPVERPALPLR